MIPPAFNDFFVDLEGCKKMMLPMLGLKIAFSNSEYESKFMSHHSPERPEYKTSV